MYHKGEKMQMSSNLLITGQACEPLHYRDTTTFFPQPCDMCVVVCVWWCVFVVVVVCGVCVCAWNGGMWWCVFAVVVVVCGV